MDETKNVNVAGFNAFQYAFLEKLKQTKVILSVCKRLIETRQS